MRTILAKYGGRMQGVPAIGLASTTGVRERTSFSGRQVDTKPGVDTLGRQGGEAYQFSPISIAHLGIAFTGFDGSDKVLNDRDD